MQIVSNQVDLGHAGENVTWWLSGKSCKMLLCNLLFDLNQWLSMYEFNTHIVKKKSKHLLKEASIAYEIERQIASENVIWWFGKQTRIPIWAN